MRCTYLAENINKCVERKAVQGGCRSLSRLICEIVNLVGQGNCIFLSKKLGISETSGCGNREWKNTYEILKKVNGGQNWI